MYPTVAKERLVLAVASICVAVCSLAFVFSRSPLSGKGSTGPATSAAGRVPQLILWAWERPSDLSFIDSRKVGVAFLSRTITLSGDRVIVQPRRQSLNVPPGTSLTAVARIEIKRNTVATFSEAQRQALMSNLKEMANAPGLAAIQIDFDAKQSERAFYRELLERLKSELPRGIDLSITALGSWCVGDRWLTNVPVDDAVPMLFRMGPDGRQLHARIQAHEEFPEEKCRNSYGVSTDEPIKDLVNTRRIYAFSPRPWTNESLRSFLERLEHEK
jgi:Protein of unknown function (DUF3142)